MNADSGPGRGKFVPEKRAQEARRRFLRTVGLTVAMVGLPALGYLPVVRAERARLRPPGAVEESDFLASCIKCGQCVQVCPVQAIKLAELDDGFGIGVPHIDARTQACDFSCDAVQCVLACPTGSLVYKKPDYVKVRGGMRLEKPPILLAKEHDADPALAIEERIGVARVTRPEACLAGQGQGFKGVARGESFTGRMRFMSVDRWKPIPLREHSFDVELCDLCVRTCPIKGAISLQPLEGGKGALPVVHEPCVGCGVCEMVCPVEPTAIEVEARKEWSA